MEAGEYAPYQLFGQDRRYVVPLFQRRYVWEEEEHWSPLWKDIKSLAEAVIEQRQDDSPSDSIGSHFLGAVVLNQINLSGLDVRADQVIDGQQRLTTLQIIIVAFHDLVDTDTDKGKRLKKSLQRLIENDTILDNKDERFKVWPTNTDRRDFEASMTEGSLEALLKRYPPQRRKHARKPDPGPPLVEAYKFFSGKIREFCFVSAESSPIVEGKKQNEGGADIVLQFSLDRAFDLFQALSRRIKLVVIDLKDGDDPQVIFETLNDRGARLLPSDLIRNFVFLRATRENVDAEELYESQWSEYDKGFWKQEKRQGRVLRTLFDLFIHHYVQYRSVKDFSIGHLYKNFCTWWEEKEMRNIVTELAEMREHSKAFERLFTSEGDTRVDIFANRLRDIDTSTVYPVLLMLLVGGRDSIEREELDGIITDLESYLVRRMICNLGTKNYNRFFLSLLDNLRTVEKKGEKITRLLVQKFLLKKDGPSVDWPNDKEFSRAWLEEPVYQTMKATKCRMVLYAIERKMLSPTPDAITIAENLTVEHVLPQEWEPTWPKPHESETQQSLEETAIERRYRLLHSLGNLTLLTSPLNSLVSNGHYDKKLPEIAEQSGLQLNKHFQKTQNWDEGEIQERGRILLEDAKKIWPYPVTEG